MFIRQNSFQKFATALPVALLLLGGVKTAVAEEPVKKEEPAKKTEPAQEEKGVLDFRAYRPGNSIFKNRGTDVPSAPLRLPQPAAPTTSRQERELLDRQKNWIFMSPGDANKTESPEEILGVNSVTLEKENSKSVLRKFLENKPADRATPGIPANGLGRSEPNRFMHESVRAPQEQKFNMPGSFNQPGRETGLFPGNSNSTEPSLSQRWQYNRPTEKMREERRAQMVEFENLFSPPNTLPVQGGLTGLNNNLGLQKDAPASLGNLDRFRPPQSPKVGDNLRTQIPGAIPGSSVTTPGGINARTFGPTALPAPTPEPPRNVSQPVSLPVPKRRF